MARELRIVFDAFPSNDGGRFIECEDADGNSVAAGEWRERHDGFVELVIRELPIAGRPPAASIHSMARARR